jgi:hypothetical protein
MHANGHEARDNRQIVVAKVACHIQLTTALFAAIGTNTCRCSDCPELCGRPQAHYRGWK